jgi:hypothetical protein
MKPLGTSEFIARHIAHGGGQGRGAEYKPGLRIQDVPSRGLSTRIFGWQTNREHHFLSKLELLYFFLLEWSHIVCDIREQYPLDLDETIAIAHQLGVRHPTNPRTKQPAVMTTDFLVTIRQLLGFEERARTIKYAIELLSLRAMEKLEIERLYWMNRSIDWGIVTELEINLVKATNIRWIHPYKDAIALAPLTIKTIRQIASLLTTKVVKENIPLRALTNSCDTQLCLPSGSSLMVIRHLIVTRNWQVDMDQPIEVPRPLCLTAKPTIKLDRKAV